LVLRLLPLSQVSVDGVGDVQQVVLVLNALEVLDLNVGEVLVGTPKLFVEAFDEVG